MGGFRRASPSLLSEVGLLFKVWEDCQAILALKAAPGLGLTLEAGEPTFKIRGLLEDFSPSCADIRCSIRGIGDCQAVLALNLVPVEALAVNVR